MVSPPFDLSGRSDWVIRARHAAVKNVGASARDSLCWLMEVVMTRLATLVSLAALCLTSAAAHAQTPVPPPAVQSDFALPSLDTKWTGDLDGMIKRRIIRILAPYSKTFYFVDRGVQRGLIYEISEIFERDLNKRLKTGNVKVHVAIIPTARGEFITALRDGRGDIAMGNLMITSERSKVVDFSDPTMKDVSEIVVTGPGGPSMGAVEDLAGKEVFITRFSSFYESVQRLNVELAPGGNPLVKVRLAPESLEPEDILEMVNAGIVKLTIADSYIAVFWKQIFTNLTLHTDVALRTDGATAWMIRKDSPRLRADLTQIEPTIHAGVKFLRAMMNEHYASEPMDRLNKGLFTFAAYNAGPGRVAQLRRLAARRGLDPNVWFNNVELMAAEKIGRETVTYVSSIYKYYLAYQMLAEERALRERARQAARPIK